MLLMVSASSSSEEDVDVLQGIAKGYRVQKDAARAALCRERGNSSFQIRDYTAAALHYSQVNRYTTATLLTGDPLHHATLLTGEPLHHATLLTGDPLHYSQVTRYTTHR